jgi:hypothetical protein
VSPTLYQLSYPARQYKVPALSLDEKSIIPFFFLAASYTSDFDKQLYPQHQDLW